MGNASGWAGGAVNYFGQASASTTDPSQQAMAEGLKRLAWAIVEIDRQNDEIASQLRRVRR